MFQPQDAIYWQVANKDELHDAATNAAIARAIGAPTRALAVPPESQFVAGIDLILAGVSRP